MLQGYQDIIKKLGEPLWWDEVGCPRYEEFKPSLCNDIYISEAALVRIACQSCGHKTLVGMSWSKSSCVFSAHPPNPLSDQIKDGYIHYGDPPPHNCCGDTMNCLDLKVLQFWKKERAFHNWERDSSLEIELPDAKADAEEQ